MYGDAPPASECVHAYRIGLACAVEPPAQRRRVGRGRKSSVAASAEEPLERSVVKVEKVACLLMRESGFFMAALSTGFKEAKDMALDYHADSEQGERPREAVRLARGLTVRELHYDRMRRFAA
jgi:hypothetical protein